MGLREIIAGVTSDAAWMDVERLLRKKYLDDAGEKERQKNMLLRRKLYDCGGTEAAFALIDQVFKDPDVRALRKEVAPYARYDNATRRIVGELSRVYAKPARKRAVAGAADNERYRELQRRTRHDQAMRLANHLLSLQNDVLVLFRVRQTDTGLEPRLDVLGQEAFWAVANPRDPSELAAVIIDQTPRTLEPKEADPHYLVWSAGESFKLDKSGRILRETNESNSLGRIPGVLIHSSYRSTCLLDTGDGEDIIAAHLAAWLVNTMMLKEAKSLNRQAAFVGETGRSPTGQAQDSERDMILAEGVGVTTIDRGVELAPYMEAADRIIERAAANHGIPPSELRHAGATSGYEIDLRRIPLEEIREDQVLIFREAERELAEIESIVCARDLPELAFDTAGWHIDFAEVKRPMPEAERFETRKLKRSMGHSDPVLEAMEDNPDFTPEQAQAWVFDRLRVYTAFVQAIRALNMPLDATVENAGQEPEDNGAEPPADESQADEEAPPSQTLALSR